MAASAVAQEAHVGVIRPPRFLALWTIALAGCAAAVAAVVITSGIDEAAPLVDAGLVAWIVLAYVSCGLIAWSRRPQSHFGPLMVAAGFAPFLSRLSEVRSGLPQTVGEVCRLLPVVLFLHVFLAYPSGRLERRFERRVVVAGYSSLAFGLAAMMLGPSGVHSSIEIASWRGVADVLVAIGRVAVVGVALTALGLLVARARSSGRPLRWSLVGACLALASVTVAAGVFVRVFNEPRSEPIKWIAFALIGLAPVLFLYGFLRARLARSAVADLFVELVAQPAPVNLRDALARALHDPSLTLAYWLPEFETYADLDGREVDLQEMGAGRAVALIDDRDGAHVAALLHDPELEDEPELLDAVSAAAGIALENGRLHAELRARLEELRGSRARIVDAGQMERKRLERNLHDGAQQRLIALSLELGLLEGALPADPDTTRRLEQARREIAISLEELRDVANGIHPAVVSGHGLEVALEQLAARGPVPVRLSVTVGDRLPERLEVAAFYLVSEGLANIGKHAKATLAAVEVARADGHLVIHVIDDGIGGADTEGGSGLRGLADRVEALDGRLQVWSPVGGGTRLRAEIPCAS